jgi:hypothetical protein
MTSTTQSRRPGTETPRAERKISIMASGTRARRRITVSGTTREAATVAPSRSFSYNQY